MKEIDSGLPKKDIVLHITRGIYKLPWLTSLDRGRGFFQRHKLAAVLDLSLRVLNFQMTFAIVHVPTEWEEMTTLNGGVETSRNSCFSEFEQHQLCRGSKFLLILVLSVFIGPAYVKIYENRLGKVL